MRITARRLLASTFIAAALVPAASAQANASQDTCDARYDRLEEQFRHMEELHGWYAAADWWDQRWHAYYTSCIAP